MGNGAVSDDSIESTSPNDGGGSAWLLVTDIDIVEARMVVGGKAAQLAALRKFGLPVPPLAALSSATADRCLDSDPQARARVGEAVAGSSDSKSARAAMRSLSIPDDLVDAIAEVVTILGRDGGVAVRSSALEEDTAATSFAGQFDSFLAVRDVDAVIGRIRDCWASQFGSRVQTYRRVVEESSVGALGMGVIIQRQIYPVKAGVMFTRHPTTGADQVYIEATFGTGEALVGGLATPDCVVLDPATGRELDRRIGSKTTLTIVRKEVEGSTTLPMPPAYARAFALTGEDIEQLRLLAESAERALGGPQDIEWAIEPDGTVWIVQARPITTLSH